MQYWSKFYASVWERKNRLPLKRFDDIKGLVSYIRKLSWRADGFKELGDAISDIEAIQWRAENTPKLFGDCDEFARYNACVISNEKWNKTSFLTVMWHSLEGYGGHNVCLINYDDGTFAFMDYSLSHAKHQTIAQVVEEVRTIYAKTPFEPLGYAVSDPWTLKPLLVSVD